MMDNMEFDKIREKLYDMQLPVEGDVWGNIQNSLRRRRLRRILYFASSAAAILLLAFMLAVPGGNSGQEAGTMIADAVPVVESTPVVQDEVQDEVQVVTDVAQVAQVADEGSDVVMQMHQAGTFVMEEEHTTLQVAVKDEQDKPEEVQENREVTGNMKPQTREVWNDDLLMEQLPYADAGRRYSVAYVQSVMPGSTASVAGSMVRASSAFGGALGHNRLVEQISDIEYSLPVNLGVQLQIPLGKNMALGIGLNYSMLKSKYDCLIDKVRYSVKQKLHYIGIPVNIYGLIADRNNFSFYVNGGVAFEKGIKAVYNLKSYRDSQSHSSDIDGVQFSINAGLGVEYKFGNVVGLYFEPNLIYYTNSEVMYSIRTDQPFHVKADIGFRFHF